MAEEHTLPGWPKKKLVKDVRKRLSWYGIRANAPGMFGVWRATWSWAAKIRNSYFGLRWPSASEIATQYVFLMLCEMQNHKFLDMPYRAAVQLSPEAAAIIGVKAIQATKPLAIGFSHEDLANMGTKGTTPAGGGAAGGEVYAADRGGHGQDASVDPQSRPPGSDAACPLFDALAADPDGAAHDRKRRRRAWPQQVGREASETSATPDGV